MLMPVNVGSFVSSQLIGLSSIYGNSYLNHLTLFVVNSLLAYYIMVALESNTICLASQKCQAKQNAVFL